jgi:hypothetical protein
LAASPVGPSASRPFSPDGDPSAFRKWAPVFRTGAFFSAD